MQTEEFDRKRAFLTKKEMFPRFRVQGKHEALEPLVQNGRIQADDDLLIVERAGYRLGFLTKHLEYHHVAEGELGGQPYVIGYCGICQSGSSLNPNVDGTHLHFGARGIYNGISLLGDDETGSYWSYITGECLYGELAGESLQVYPLERIKASYALKQWPDLQIALSRPQLLKWLMSPIKRLMGKHTYIPPIFRYTLGKPDERLSREVPGLGLISSRKARFYPLQLLQENGVLEDEWNGRPIQVNMDYARSFPYAVFTDEPNNESSLNWPMQLYSRWYGFSLTFPRCEIYASKSS